MAKRSASTVAPTRLARVAIGHAMGLRASRRLGIGITFLVSLASCGGEAPLDPDPNRCQPGDFVCVKQAPGTTVAALGTPYDPTLQDTFGPDDAAPMYGAAPRYIAVPGAGGAIDLLWVSTDKEAERAFHFQLRRDGATYRVGRAFALTNAGRVVGFSRDEVGGDFYYATAVAESLAQQAEPKKLHRPDIVHLVRYDASGRIRSHWDLGAIRGAEYPASLPLYSPLTASSARIRFGGGRVATLFGVNTELDEAIKTRHQMARYMELDVAVPAPAPGQPEQRLVREAGTWVSHSFDQRLDFDGRGFTELHLGDAYPRSIVLAFHRLGEPVGKPVTAFAIKGREGDNNTFTRLGGQVQIGDGVYLVLFAAETNPAVAIAPGFQRLAGPRNLGLSRVTLAGGLDAGFGAPFAVTVTSAKGEARAVTNRVLWLTDGRELTAQVERPRIARLAPGRNLVLYERWIRAGLEGGFRYAGSRALIVDDAGVVVKAEVQLSGEPHRIGRGDDLYVVDGRALWCNGEQANRRIRIHTLDGELKLETSILE